MAGVAFAAVLAMAPATPALSASQPPADGVISYPAAFFSAQQPANADEMVTRIPGFSVDPGSSVRGYEGAAGNVLVDGQRPASKTDNLDEVLRRIPTSEVERIDVIHGGAPGIDMQGKTVIANVVRKKKGRPYGVLLAAIVHAAKDGRDAPQVRIEGGGGAPGHAWEGSLRTGGYFDSVRGGGPLTRADGAGHLQSVARAGSRGDGGQTIALGSVETPDAGGSLRLNARVAWNGLTYRETDAVSFPSPALRRDRQEQGVADAELGARDTRRIGADGLLETVALRQSERFAYKEAFQSPSDTLSYRLIKDTSEIILRSALKLRQGSSLSWQIGAEGAFNTLRARTSLSDNGAAVILPAANVRVEETRGEAFAKATWQALPAVTIEAVLRQEGSTIRATGDAELSKTLYFTKPRLLLTWVLDPQTQVRLRYERVVGQLNFADFVGSSSLSTGVLTAGNPNLNPEQDSVVEGAVERRFLGAGLVSLTLRHTAINDAIDHAPAFSGANVFDQPGNIGAGTKDEFIAQAAIPLGWLGLAGAELRGAGAWRHSMVTDPTTHSGRGISALHPVDWEGHFIQDVPRLGLNWGIDAIGGWRETYYRFNEIETRKYRTYLTPFLEWRPSGQWSVRMELDNATSRKVRDGIVHYAGPRSAAPVQFVQDRQYDVGPAFYLRLRRTFGS